MINEMTGKERNDKMKIWKTTIVAVAVAAVSIFGFKAFAAPDPTKIPNFSKVEINEEAGQSTPVDVARAMADFDFDSLWRWSHKDLKNSFGNDPQKMNNRMGNIPFIIDPSSIGDPVHIGMGQCGSEMCMIFDVPVKTENGTPTFVRSFYTLGGELYNFGVGLVEENGS